MSRLPRTDQTLDALNGERDHLAIRISLLGDSETPDRAQLAALREELAALERQISKYRPAEADA